MKPIKLSIIIPAYNEESNIEATLYELESYMNSYKGGSSWEIIVVNDGSLDNTLKILNSIKESKTWLKVIDLVTNHGRGRALRKGFEESSGDIIVSLDADLSYAPYHIERMVDKLVANDAEIVLASAYGKGGTVKNVPYGRLLISRMGNKILSYMFGGDISVLTCIVRAYKTDFIQKLDLHSNNKDIHLEILSKAKILGAKILEIPADLKWRESKLSVLNEQSQRRSSLKLRKTTRSHFFYALMSNPGLIYMVPGYVLFAVSFFIFILCCKSIYMDFYSGTSLYFAIRNSMLNATPSWLTLTFSFILSIQFFSLGFLTNQNKRNHEEIYKAINTIFKELRKKG